MFFRSTTLVLATVATASVSAQSLSSGCRSVFLGLAANPEASTCLNAGGIIDLAITTGANDSLINPVSSWVSGMCSAGSCSNNTLAAIVTNVTSGCSSDLNSVGLSNINTDDAIDEVQLVYPTLRKVLCLKDTSANNLCITQDLTTLQDILGETLTLSNFISSISKLATIAYSGKVNSSQVCTDCIKAAYTVIQQDFPSAVSGSASTFQSECGSDFTNGQIPSHIQVSAASGTVSAQSNASGSGAISMTPVGVVGTMATSLVAVIAGFALLA